MVTMKKMRYMMPYLRVLIGIHEYFEGSMAPELAKHQQTLAGLTVAEAVESIAAYADTYREICCLYACVAFIKRFPKANARLAFSPEENPLQKKPNRGAAKVVLVIGDTVYDLVSMIGDKSKKSLEDLIEQYCNIPIAKYCQKHLLEGEELTVLPLIAGHESENFLRFFFANKEAEHYSL